MILVIIVVLLLLALGSGGYGLRSGWYGSSFNGLGLVPVVLIIVVVYLLVERGIL